MAITLADIEAARQTIAGRVLRTPMLPAPKLSALTGASVRSSDTIISTIQSRVGCRSQSRDRCSATVRLDGRRCQARTYGPPGMSAVDRADVRLLLSYCHAE